MTNKQILESIRALAQGECIHHDGESCRVTRRPCHVVHPHSDSLREAIDCDFFLRYMLPAGWNMQDLIALAAAVVRHGGSTTGNGRRNR